jgi:hypothetical protein
MDGNGRCFTWRWDENKVESERKKNRMGKKWLRRDETENSGIPAESEKGDDLISMQAGTPEWREMPTPRAEGGKWTKPLAMLQRLSQFTGSPGEWPGCSIVSQRNAL